jgi:hypothetical protein
MSSSITWTTPTIVALVSFLPFYFLPSSSTAPF